MFSHACVFVIVLQSFPPFLLFLLPSPFLLSPHPGNFTGAGGAKQSPSLPLRPPEDCGDAGLCSFSDPPPFPPASLPRGEPAKQGSASTPSPPPPSSTWIPEEAAAATSLISPLRSDMTLSPKRLRGSISPSSVIRMALCPQRDGKKNKMRIYPSQKAPASHGFQNLFLFWTAPLRLLDLHGPAGKRIKVKLHCFDHRLGHIKIALSTWLHLPQHSSPTCSTSERCCLWRARGPWVKAASNLRSRGRYRRGLVWRVDITSLGGDSPVGLARVVAASGRLALQCPELGKICKLTSGFPLSVGCPWGELVKYTSQGREKHSRVSQHECSKGRVRRSSG